MSNAFVFDGVVSCAMSVHKRKTKRGVVYDVRWREGQKNKGRTFDTRADAVAFEAEQRRRQRLGAHAPGEPSTMPLGDWLERWFTTEGVAWEATTRRTRAHLVDKWILPWLGDVALRDIGRSAVREFRAEIVRAGSPPVNTNNVTRVLSAALGAAEDEGLIPANPCRRLGRVRTEEAKRRHHAPEVVNAIAQAMDDPRDQVAVAILYWAGLRPGELCALEWGDVNEGFISVTGSVQGGKRRPVKTAQPRAVPIEPPLAAALTALRGRNDGGGDLVIPAPRGGYLDWHNWTARIWRRARERVGSDAIPAEMRHSCASRWIMEGHDVLTVASWLGHHPSVTLRNYAHLMATSPAPALRSGPSGVAASDGQVSRRARPRDPRS